MTSIYGVTTALLLARAATSFALDPSTPLSSYGRQSWTVDNGLPQNTVQALAQTPDGFLWLGTEAGLVRFDGISFQSYVSTAIPALPSDVRCLLVTKDGVLWVGTPLGILRWNGGTLAPYTSHDEFQGVVRGIVQTDDSSVWILTDSGLAQVSGARMSEIRNRLFREAVASNPAAKPLNSSTTSEDRPIKQYAQEPKYISDSGEKQFRFFAAIGHSASAIGTKTQVTIIRGGIEPSGQDKVIARLTVGRELPGSKIQTLAADREGSLWIGSNHGLARWTKGKVERFPPTDSLARASVLAITEDREGNLWVGTEESGLNVIRNLRFSIIGTAQGLSSERITTVAGDATGTIWVGTESDGVNALRRGQGTMDWHVARTFTADDGLTSNVILSMAIASNGDLWVGTPDGLNRIRGTHVDRFTSADGLPDDFVRSLLSDDDGSLWIGTRHGLAHWVTGRVGDPNSGMETYTRSNGLASDLVGAMVRDANGELWVATLSGLSRFHDRTISNFTTANGLSNNVVTALLPRPDGTLLIGTQDGGWDRWDGLHFSSMHDGLEHKTIRAILDDDSGHLWFATADGIARCDCNSMDAQFIANPHSMNFGGADGLGGGHLSSSSHPAGWRSSDGHLWFATPKGLVQVDPSHFLINTLPPPVAFEGFRVDDVPQTVSPGLSPKIGAGHVHFEFDYAGLSLVAPQTVHYRYILDGFDKGWTDAGARRAAYYTNIPPGRYTFRVQAANNDGIWNTAGSAFSFELKPHYYQTVWFYILVVAAVTGLVVLMFRVRVSRAQRSFQLVLAERTRIAREIHDTLAQGYTGVSIQLEVLTELIRQHRDLDAASQLDRTREYVREGLADARQSIWALRTQESTEDTLPLKLQRMADAAESNGLRTQFSIFGAYRAIPADTEREMIRVAQEAIHNVTKHSGASLLSVKLEYDAQFISLEVQDDGRGGASLPDTHASSRHFGLTGMKERAAAIGGTLVVDSFDGVGTTVRLSVPMCHDASGFVGVRQ